MKSKKKFLQKYMKYLSTTIYFLVIIVVTSFSESGQVSGNLKDMMIDNEVVKLIVRGDDMGISHATNLAIIDSYKQGIETSAEIIVPGPWFLEAADMLRENPGLDVGVHLALTSEWENLKWRPVMDCPSLVDSNGYFFPVVWSNNNFEKNEALKSQSWAIDEIEKELRGQIELALKHIPSVSHLSCHMGFQSIAPEVDRLIEELAEEYELYYKTNLKRLEYKKDKTNKSYIRGFIEALDDLSAGTYLYVEHPSLDGPEMQTVYMKGYRDVAEDRQKVTNLFTNEKVKKTIRQKGIKLIGYKDL